ncbi:MAG: hypothetical protein AAGI68_16715 [Planctomycetota bacterium]
MKFETPRHKRDPRKWWNPPPGEGEEARKARIVERRRAVAIVRRAEKGVSMRSQWSERSIRRLLSRVVQEIAEGE